MAGPGTVEYVGRIQLDAAEFMKALHGLGGIGAGAAGLPPTGAGSQEEQAKVIQKGMRKAHRDPSFLSIFRPLAALEGIKQLVQNSRVMSAYLGGMGKVFSAAIDLLLLPFTPILNLLLIGLSKLIAWLIDSGALEFIGEGVNKLVKLFEGFGKWVEKLFTDPGAAFMEAVKWLWEQIKSAFKDPGRALKTIAQLGVAGAGTAILGQMAMGAIGLGGIGPIALGVKGIRALFGRGRAPVEEVAATTAANTAAETSLLARLGLRGGRALGINSVLAGGALMAGGVITGQTLGQQGGALGAIGRMGSLTATGAGIGTMIMPGWGTGIGALAGLGVGVGQELGIPGAGSIARIFGAGKPRGGEGAVASGAGAKVTNIGTQNITMNIKVDDPKLVKEMYKQLEEQTTQSAMEG